MKVSTKIAAGAVVIAASLASALAQREGVFGASRDHPAIDYATAPVSDAVSELNRKIQRGAVQLTFDPASGYLRSVLDALSIPSQSQVLVFSQTSFQAHRINPRNPRAVFFADSVAVGWVRGGAVVEVAVHDPRQGVVFYALDQVPAATPQFKRNDNCLACHLAWETLAVPGLLVLSTFPMPEDKNAYATGGVSDHRTPFPQRWGGWYVTGNPGVMRHLGNVLAPKADGPDSNVNEAVAPLPSLDARFDTEGYLTPHSDIVALMVLEHQAHMTNLITQIGWEARLALYQDRTGRAPEEAPAPRRDAIDRVRTTAAALVDYLLFVDEAPLPGPIQGSSRFAETFSARGPSDTRGRSLRQLDLQRRLMRYPCSYMIYTEAFDALPPVAKDAIYERMWQILSGQERQERYLGLSPADRQAIVEILRETKDDLPDYFQPVTQ